MFTFKISTGELFGPPHTCADPIGPVWGKGYSGHGEGVDNPADESISNVGPIPEGKWSIGAPEDSPNTGPFTLPLAPLEGTDARGRSDFRIHGDLVGEVGKELASHGCIILARPIRERINGESDRTLCVVR